jgi:hypothetical protein
MASRAEAAQAEQMQLEADQAEWRSIGETAIGQHVATREVFAWWDADISLASLLEPTHGTETPAEAVAWARISGQSSAVMKVEDRFYVYATSTQFSYDNVFSAEQFEEKRSEVVPAPDVPSRVTLITTEGYVLSRRGERYFGGIQSDQPERVAEGTASVLEQTENLSSDQALALFKHATLDILLINLSGAEKRLRSELAKVFPAGFGFR